MMNTKTTLRTNSKFLPIGFACLVMLWSTSASAMSWDGHIYGQGSFGGIKDLTGTSVADGGIGEMSFEKMSRIQTWIDAPASQTGEYINRLAGGKVLSPSNHNALRHNPVGVAKVFSGDGSIAQDALNVARLHKIQDMAHNVCPIDGWQVTPSRTAQASEILSHVDSFKKLPSELPHWVDARGPLITEKTLASTKTISAIPLLAGRVVAGVGILAGGAQAADGIQDIQNDHIGIGGAKLTGGAANATSSVAWLAGRSSLSGVAGGVGAVVDGGIQIYQGVQEDDSFKVTIGSVKATAGICMAAGTATGQPEIVLPAAIVYGGAVVTDIAHENAAELAEFASLVNQSARSNLNDAAWAIYNRTPEAIATSPLFQKATGWFNGF